MRSLITLACLGLLLAAPVASAQIIPADDIVGIYFDSGATQTSYYAPAMYQNNQAYLILTNFSGSGTLGWELTVEFDNGGGFSSVTSWAPRGSWVNADTPPGFAVGLATPLYGGPIIVVMDLAFFYTGGTCYFYLSPNSSPSIPGHMAALDGADVGHIIPIFPSSGAFEYPVACVDCETFATEPTSWGAVRSLYR